MEEVPQPWAAARPARIRWRNVLLFVFTAATTVKAGSQWVLGLEDQKDAWTRIAAGLPYASALLAILIAHEMGHYLMARAHRVDSTAPFFIPGPWNLFGAPMFGTFGAVMLMRSEIPDRRALLDIGAAGPIAGFVVAVPLYALGMAHSQVRAVGDAYLGGGAPHSLVQVLLASLRGQDLLDAVSAYQSFGDSLVTWGLQRLVVGELPPHHEVFIHPVALAAWLGFLVTALNLLPVGQLDGGHVVYAWLGRERAQRVFRLVSWALLGLGLLVSWNWLAWWAITRFVLKLRHPPTQRDEEPLDRGRTAVALISLAILVLTFMPAPV